MSILNSIFNPTNDPALAKHIADAAAEFCKRCREAKEILRGTDEGERLMREMAENEDRKEIEE
jgi:hypothetical protein